MQLETSPQMVSLEAKTEIPQLPDPICLKPLEGLLTFCLVTAHVDGAEYP